MADVLLFAAADAPRILLNLGGMANLTYVERRAQEDGVLAFDTGPGVAIIDATARLVDRRSGFDRDGHIAAQGTVNPALLRELLDDPFFNAPPPKSTGRERFGDQYAQALFGRLPGPDAVATAVELTGRHGTVTGVMLSDGTRIDADMIIVGVGVAPRTELAAAAGLKIDNGIVVDEHLRTSDPDIFAAGDIAQTYSPRLGRHIRVEHWANARRQGAVAAKAMLGQDAVDVRPSYFFTDQYDLSMEYTGDIGPSGYDQVIFRRYPDPRQLIVFWLSEQRVQTGMNINIWDVADDIERLVQSPHPANTDHLADPGIPLASVHQRPAGPVLLS